MNSKSNNVDYMIVLHFLSSLRSHIETYEPTLSSNDPTRTICRQVADARGNDIQRLLYACIYALSNTTSTTRSTMPICLTEGSLCLKIGNPW